MAEAFDFTSAMVVSGDAWNPCGHMLLKVGAADGYYFHVAGPYVRRKFMQELGFLRYLRENRKLVLSRRPVDIKNPQGPRQSLTN